MSIEISHISKSFGATSVLRDFSLTVSAPLVLMGPSGCGKTTLLRIVMGLEAADGGSVTGVGRPGVVFQENRLCPQLSALGNICLVGNVPAPAAEDELTALGFTAGECTLPAASLSGGQKRRAALLRALLCRGVDTLLLDEPFTGMDAALVTQAAAAIRRLAANRPTLLVTHDGAAAQLLGWKILQMA